jgi:hypothetical protein
VDCAWGDILVKQSRRALVALFLLLFMVPFLRLAPAHAAQVTCPDGKTADREGSQTYNEACGIVASVPCTPKQSILGLPTWYTYLPGDTKDITISTINGDERITQCVPTLRCGNTSEHCTADTGIDVGKIWLIAFAVLELLLRLTGVIAVFMVMFGGIKYVTSRGQPDATKGARQTIINAAIGIAISIIAAVSVNFGAKLLQ